MILEKVSMYAELDYNDMLEMKDGGIYITNISDENAIAGGTYIAVKILLSGTLVYDLCTRQQ